MAAQGDATANRPGKKARLKAKRRASGELATPGEADDEQEEVNPGMLLTDFINEPRATGRKAVKSAERSAKASKMAKVKKSSAGSSDEGEQDLFAWAQAASQDQGEDAGASAKLIGAISAAGSSKAANARRPRHAEEALPESEFHVGTGGDEITMEDLLAPLQESTGFGDVKKMLGQMSKKEAMPEPMNEVKQGREERATRYQVSSNDIKKFIPQVQRMKKADQVDMGENQDGAGVSTTATLVGTFRATDDFEKELEEVTKAAGATEQDMIDQKGLPMNSRIRDEKQTQQVAKLKALMMREQQANKRIKKIKSKTYHRIHRKAEHREREVLLDRLEHDNPELAKSLRQDYEKKHAERRLQRSRNARKKWAQTMQRFAKGSEGAQKEISKQAQDARDEQRSLRRVISGKDADQSDDSEAMDLSDSDGEGGGKGKKSLSQRTVDKAKQLTLQELNDLKNGGELPTTGMLGLAFMRNAIKQKRDAAQADAQSVLHELEGVGAKLEAEGVPSDEESEERQTRKDAAAKALVAPKKREFSAEELEQAGREVDVLLEQEDATQSQGMSVSGPLTVRGVEAQKVPAFVNQATATSSSSKRFGAATTAESSKSKAKASSAGTSESQVPAEDNPWNAAADEENPWLAAEPPADAATPSAPSAPAADGKKAAKRKGAAASAESGKKRKRRRGREESASEGEAEEHKKEVTSSAELLNVLDEDADAARQQRDLVRATFVEGTQAEDFDEEKEEKMREEEEKDNPKELLGWGSWTGDGVKPRDPKKGKGKGSGKGKGKGAGKAGVVVHSTPKPDHVSVREGDGEAKSQAKFFVDKVPYPFKNPAQYNQEMRMPSGPEWNTLAGHLQRVKPKIFTKVGAIVAPLQYIKHLPAEQQEGAINTWAKSKQPKRLKARF